MDNTLGRNIRRRRCDLGMSQLDLTQALAKERKQPLPLGRISEWERGEVRPSALVLPSLAVVLETTVEDLAPLKKKSCSHCGAQISSLGFQLRRLRTRAEMTQSDLNFALRQATGCRLAHARISDWERGVLVPNKKMLAALAEILEDSDGVLRPSEPTPDLELTPECDPSLPRRSQMLRDMFDGTFRLCSLRSSIAQ